LVGIQVLPQDKPFPWLRWFGMCVIVGLAGSIILYSTFVPFAYMQHAYPEPRALVTSRYVMIICQAAIGWLAGSVVLPFLNLFWKPVAASTERLPQKETYLVLAAAVFLLAFSVYPLHAASGELSTSWHYQKWARFWDARNLTIIEARRQNISNVKIMNIDHIIPNVAELSPDYGFWYNGCASIYYDVTTISASLPGWDKPDQKPGQN